MILALICLLPPSLMLAGELCAMLKRERNRRPLI